MTFTYDLSTKRGKVRLLATDTDESRPIFSDDEIDALLDMESDVVDLAAARALETIASNEALVQKKLKQLDLQTDGPAVAKELRERARQLREDYDAGEGGIVFADADIVDDAFGRREKLGKEYLRRGL